MHIADGIVSPALLATGGVITLTGVGLGLGKLKHEELPQTALLTATFYMASLIHVPIGPASGHLMLAGLLAAILRIKAAPAILIALFLQFFTFQHGGLTVLGVNWTIMALPAVAIAYTPIKKIPFLVGFLSIIFSSLLLVTTLYLSDPAHKVAISLILVGNLPVAVVEGLITMFVVRFLKKVRPEILR